MALNFFPAFFIIVAATKKAGVFVPDKFYRLVQRACDLLQFSSVTNGSWIETLKLNTANSDTATGDMGYSSTKLPYSNI
jgi:hypothetical protein